MNLFRIKSLLYKHLIISSSFERIIDVFYWPMVDLLIWGFASVYIGKMTGAQTTTIFLLGAILRTCESRGAQDLPIFILEDYWSRNLYYLFSSPVRISEQIFALGVICFTRAVTSLIFVAFMGKLCFNFNMLSYPLKVLVPATLLLFLYGWCIGILIASCIIRWGEKAQFLAWSIFWLFQPFSCVFYPREILPNWAKTISLLLPNSYIYEALSWYQVGGDFNYSSLRIASILSVGLFIFSVFIFNISYKYAIKMSLFAKSY